MIRQVGAVALALLLSFPAFVLADVELTGTIVKVDEAENEILVKTERGEETLLVGQTTKGMENVKEGAKVKIRYSEKDGRARVSEIMPEASF